MRVSPGVILLLVLASAATVAEESDVPPLELLEFLGEWQDAEGNEIDPQALALLQMSSTQQGGGKSDDKE